jgi:hypothetical protein
VRTRRTGIAICAAIVTGAIALALVLSDHAEPGPAAPARRAAGTVDSSPPRTVASGRRPRGIVVDCPMRSEANFPGAFTDRRNLVVGPLVLIGGGEPTPADVVWKFGGNKFPLLVKAGHTVTLRLPARVRPFAGLAYGPLPQRETQLRDTHRTITFVACRPGNPSGKYRPNGPSGSSADGASVTFWSGFVLTRRPACLALEVWVDGELSPRRAVLKLGASRC